MTLHLGFLSLGGEYTQLHAGPRAAPGGAMVKVRRVLAQAPRAAAAGVETAAPTADASVATVAPGSSNEGADAGEAVPPVMRDPVRPDAPASEAAPAAPAAVPEDSDELYLPRRLLDEAPRLLSRIDLPWPEDGTPNGHYREVLSLFVDEDGSVRRVRVEGQGLPPSLQAIAQEAFLHARFAPGQMGGRPVKAWIRLEVAFDAEARIRPHGVRR